MSTSEQKPTYVKNYKRRIGNVHVDVSRLSIRAKAEHVVSISLEDKRIPSNDLKN